MGFSMFSCSRSFRSSFTWMATMIQLSTSTSTPATSPMSVPSWVKTFFPSVWRYAKVGMPSVYRGWSPTRILRSSGEGGTLSACRGLM